MLSFSLGKGRLPSHVGPTLRRPLRLHQSIFPVGPFPITSSISRDWAVLEDVGHSSLDGGIRSGIIVTLSFLLRWSWITHRQSWSSDGPKGWMDNDNQSSVY